MQEYQKAVEDAEEKVSIATQTYDLVKMLHIYFSWYLSAIDKENYDFTYL